MKPAYSEAVETARSYYNSEDADNFYALIWGGEDIHIGLYQTPGEEVAAASRRTVEQMASLLNLGAGHRVLDIGSGYGGAARYLASRFGCQVDALNLSEKENQRARQLNAEQGLSERIRVLDASFEQIPADPASYDMVWSQDAMLHSGDRPRVLAEVARVLKPGGYFIFTDPMQADGCPQGVLKPILDRIHLSSLGSPAFYRSALGESGFEELVFEERTAMLAHHYERVLEETRKAEDGLMGRVSKDYLERMKKGLTHWVEGGRQGHLCWGIFLFRKAG